MDDLVAPGQFRQVGHASAPFGKSPATQTALLVEDEITFVRATRTTTGKGFVGGLWLGVETGKRVYRCVAIDAADAVVLSWHVVDDETALRHLIATVLATADGAPVVWVTDLNIERPSLLLDLLKAHGQRVLHVPRSIVQPVEAIYPGGDKPNARDARITADYARIRRDLKSLDSADQISSAP
ncbi:IS110 family transposase [Rhodococcus pyridinivorans]|uniref:IS110 family transposase n=1 Tax=Rhodococcus pyridinivorans TaxID=103816 RepID=UPI0020C5CAAA|nr:IS110 family transposase [Rhodococcus pyridinivorans]UTM38024.1 IS110 family transposase [Rhodococcus pyridinivorans]